MAKKLAINVNMFAMDQQMVIIDENNEVKSLGGAPMNRVGELAASFAQNNDVDEIQITGQKDFAQAVVINLKEFLNTNYNTNVRVYLNGEICN